MYGTPSTFTISLQLLMLVLIAVKSTVAGAPPYPQSVGTLYSQATGISNLELNDMLQSFGSGPLYCDNMYGLVRFDFLGTMTQLSSPPLPCGSLTDLYGTVYFTTPYHEVIWTVSYSDQVTEYSGTMFTSGTVSGTLSGSTYTTPFGIVGYPAVGALYVVDDGTIRKIDVAAGQVTTIASSANFNGARFLTINYNGSHIYTGRYTVLRVDTMSGDVQVLADASGGYADGDAATTAKLDEAMGYALSRNETHLLIADSRNYVIRRLNLCTMFIDTVAGQVGVSGGTTTETAPRSAAFSTLRALQPYSYGGSCGVFLPDTNFGSAMQRYYFFESSFTKTYYTCDISHSFSGTATRSLQHRTLSGLPSLSQSQSANRSHTPTLPVTRTYSHALSPTYSPSKTRSATLSRRTATPLLTISKSPNPTATMPLVPTPTVTSSHNTTLTRSVVLVPTPSSTPTPNATLTPSIARTPSPSWSTSYNNSTPTGSIPPTPSPSWTDSHNATPTETVPISPSQSSSSSRTTTRSDTNSHTVRLMADVEEPWGGKTAVIASTVSVGVVGGVVVAAVVALKAKAAAAAAQAAAAAPNVV